MLTKCTNCGNLVSDRAVRCPHCGYNLKEKDATEMSNDVTAETKNHNGPIIERKSSNNIGTIITIIILVVIFAVVGFFAYQKYRDQDKNEVYADTTVSESFNCDTTSVKADNCDNVRIQSVESNVSERNTSNRQIESKHDDENVEFVAQLASTRILDYNDISGLSKSERRIVRNWIFARYGYAFKSPELQRYFGRKSWYTPMHSDVSSRLSKIERQNVAFIKQYE